MNAHKLIDNIRILGQRRLNRSIYGDAFETYLNGSQKFYFGALSEMPVAEGKKYKIYNDQYPYERMYCEFSSDKQIVGGLIVKDESMVYVDIFTQFADGSPYMPIGGGWRIDTELETTEFITTLADEERAESMQFMQDQAFRFIAPIMECIRMMNCSNVCTMDNIPSRLKQQRQKKKSKTPLFTYKTLHITNAPKKKGLPGGGTHASPRIHLRRGHIRTLPTGSTTWVQPCVVGDKSKGIVHKDYSFRAEPVPE